MSKEVGSWSPEPSGPEKEEEPRFTFILPPVLPEVSEDQIELAEAIVETFSALDIVGYPVNYRVGDGELEKATAYDSTQGHIVTTDSFVVTLGPDQELLNYLPRRAALKPDPVEDSPPKGWLKRFDQWLTERGM